MYNNEQQSMYQVYPMQTAQFHALQEAYSIVGLAITKFAKVFTR